MKRYFSAAAITVLAGAIALLTGSAGATTPTTTGTWTSYPAQTYSTSTSISTGAAYQTAVRPPVNADGSSNWPAKRGVIPVQFDLLSAPTTITTTTKTYDPPVWQSLNQSPGVGVPGSVSWAKLALQPKLTLDDITNLSATYSFTTGDCFGGSLRWDIRLVHNGTPQTLEVYYGNPNGVPDPPGQSCSGAQSESGKNLLSTSDATLPTNRFEFLGGWGVPGPLYTTWADVLASTNNGTDQVNNLQLTLDSGWKADQIADVSDVTVNDNTWFPKTTETSSATVVGDFAKTCTLPDAKLRWSKNDATATGAVNEAESIQPKDTGVYYRQVDCK